MLTTAYDNLPGWSPDGVQIVFTRRVDDENYDIFTIRPDGSGLKRLTTNGANDDHAVWTADGRIMWSSGIYGFLMKRRCMTILSSLTGRYPS